MARDGRPPNVAHNADTLRVLAKELREKAKFLDAKAKEFEGRVGKQFVLVAGQQAIDDGLGNVTSMCSEFELKINRDKLKEPAEVKDRVWEPRTSR